MTRARRIHFDATPAPADGAAPILRLGLCGFLGINTTTELALVTCRLCERRLREAPASPIDALGALTFVPSGPYIRRRGATEAVDLDPAAPKPVWLTETQALRELVEAEDAGWATKSVSDPTRFEVTTTGGSEGRTRDIAQRQVERLHEVWRARESAFTGAYVVQDLPLLELSPSVCTEILLLRSVGRAVRKRTEGRKGEWIDRIVDPPEVVADAITEALGFRVTAGTIETVARVGRTHVRAYLSERGLLPRLVRRVDPLRGDDVPKDLDFPWDYKGWKEIATALECSESAARRYAEDPQDPLPVKVAFGRVIANKREVEEWIARHVRNRGRRSEQK